MQVAYECGYTSMPILFNGNGMSNDDEPKTLSLEYRKVQEEFCEKMIETLKDEPGLLMWDIMNEPYISYFLQQSPPEKRAERRARVDEFIKYFINFVRERDPDNAITVGYALTSSFEPTVGLCDVISIHNYDRKYEDIKREHQITSEVAAKYGATYIDVQGEFDKHLVHRYPAYISWDRVHPNWVGGMIIAKEILKAVGADPLY